MHASILVVGHPSPEAVEFGAEHSITYDEGLESAKKNKYAVIVASGQINTKGSERIKDYFSFLHACRLTSPETQTVLVSASVSPEDLQKAINAVGLFKIIPRFDSNLLQLAVREALEEYELIKQNQAFLALTQEQNLRLQHLTSILEDKVKAREGFLNETREKLLKATRRTEALNRALVTIQKSVTKQEIEIRLKDALQVALGLSWSKILFRDQSFSDSVAEAQVKNSTIFSAPLLRGKELLGHIYFARDQKRPFTTDEDDFLLQVTDAVSLAIDRLMALEAIEGLKKEWDSTFDAITDPVAIIDEDYKILRANRAYAEKAQTSLEALASRKCYETLFEAAKPCDGCRLGQNFDLSERLCADKSQVSFTVNSHFVQLHNGRKNFAMFYHDAIEEQRIQRQILESSKMAEIGTIGSSIAHEINNPLGGMIAFLQILKGEIPAAEKIYTDVIEMEQAAIRCKTIVENLLAFTRKSSHSEMKITRLGDLVKLVNNIIELQTRGLGIKIEKQLEDSDVKINADTNQLVQVLVNIMQNSCEALADRLSNGLRTPAPKISIRSSFSDEEKDHLVIEITDNGTGIPASDLPRVFSPFFTTKDRTKNPGLGLSVSYQIINEHGGQMEISSIVGQSTTVFVKLPIAKSLTP